MSEYEYTVTETSIDTRCWIIKSNEKLSENDIMEIYVEVGFDNEGEEVQYCSDIITKYCGTLLGDDTQVSIEGDLE